MKTSVDSKALKAALANIDAPIVYLEISRACVIVTWENDFMVSRETVLLQHPIWGGRSEMYSVYTSQFVELLSCDCDRLIQVETQSDWLDFRLGDDLYVSVTAERLEPEYIPAWDEVLERTGEVVIRPNRRLWDIIISAAAIASRSRRGRISLKVAGASLVIEAHSSCAFLSVTLDDFFESPQEPMSYWLYADDIDLMVMTRMLHPGDRFLLFLYRENEASDTFFRFSTELGLAFVSGRGFSPTEIEAPKKKVIYSRQMNSMDLFEVVENSQAGHPLVYFERDLRRHAAYVVDGNKSSCLRYDGKLFDSRQINFIMGLLAESPRLNIRFDENQSIWIEQKDSGLLFNLFPCSAKEYEYTSPSLDRLFGHCLKMYGVDSCEDVDLDEDESIEALAGSFLHESDIVLPDLGQPDRQSLLSKLAASFMKCQSLTDLQESESSFLSAFICNALGKIQESPGFANGRTIEQYDSYSWESSGSYYVFYGALLHWLAAEVDQDAKRDNTNSITIKQIVSLETTRGELTPMPELAFPSVYSELQKQFNKK